MGRGGNRKECKAALFNQMGLTTLGSQHELNRTFAYIQPKMTDVVKTTFTSAENATYSIFNVKPTFHYQDSQQIV
jgi:hypothetical protein